MFYRAIHRFKLGGLCALIAATALLSACGGQKEHATPAAAASAAPATITSAIAVPNLVDVIKADPRFSILSEAVVAADLAGALSGPGPLTLFAPTNDAFALLLAELNVSKVQLLADKALLTSVLTYHVLPAKVAKADVPVGKAITTLQVGIFKIDSVGSDLVVTDGRNRTARITQTDVTASNGLLHVVDKVLLPANKTLVETIQAKPELSVLVETINAAGLAGALNAAGPFTLFAPTNDAFAALFAELKITKSQMLANPALITTVLNYHLLSSRVLKAEVPVGSPIKSVQGSTFVIDAGFVITDQLGRKARITATDLLASNGVIHVIDKVISPPTR